VNAIADHPLPNRERDCVQPLLDEEGKTRSTGWRAKLSLRYERRSERTVLAERRHAGPMLVQKALYPEGEQVCHGIVLHPPGGIVGGDELALNVAVGARASALLTTPGATKWYRSSGSEAHQSVRFHVARGGSLEWLPQPAIVFDGALGANACEISVDEDACYIGWDVWCLGRTASGERLRAGRMTTRTQIDCGSVPLFLERAAIEGGSRLLDSPVGLNGQPISGTLGAVVPRIESDVVTACRSIKPSYGHGGVTRLPRVIVARYLGDRAEAAFAYFVSLWEVLRPALLARVAASPRIWRT
jgi:urease accessory protein